MRQQARRGQAVQQARHRPCVRAMHDRECDASPLLCLRVRVRAGKAARGGVKLDIGEEALVPAMERTAHDAAQRVPHDTGAALAGADRGTADATAAAGRGARVRSRRRARRTRVSARRPPRAYWASRPCERPRARRALAAARARMGRRGGAVRRRVSRAAARTRARACVRHTGSSKKEHTGGKMRHTQRLQARRTTPRGARACSSTAECRWAPPTLPLQPRCARGAAGRARRQARARRRHPPMSKKSRAQRKSTRTPRRRCWRPPHAPPAPWMTAAAARAGGAWARAGRTGRREEAGEEEGTRQG